MEADIKEKITRILLKDNYTEEDVTYFFVEAYKLLESSKQEKVFNIIGFYRNWICHSSITKDSEKIFDDVYVLIRARSYFADAIWRDLMTDKIIKSFGKYSFFNLFEQIELFLKKYLNQISINWKDLRIKLYKVIEETPLSIIVNKKEIFRFICAEFPEEIDFDHFKLLVVADNVEFRIIGKDEDI